MKQAKFGLRRWFTAALLPAFVLAGLLAPLAPAGLARAAEALPEHVYFDATISKGSHTVSRPQALVKVGAKAALSVGRASAEGPRFGLRYVVEQPEGAAMFATVTGLVDGHEVASGTIVLPGGQGLPVTMDGGGYTWRFQAQRMTTELMSRRGSAR